MGCRSIFVSRDSSMINLTAWKICEASVRRMPRVILPAPPCTSYHINQSSRLVSKPEQVIKIFTGRLLQRSELSYINITLFLAAAGCCADLHGVHIYAVMKWMQYWLELTSCSICKQAGSERGQTGGG